MASLLHWYARHRRSLPWRASAGEAPDPYRVWLSEVMLQQTTVAAVIPYFQRFVAEFPSIQALAAAEENAVMRAWAGLGYYARARNLHACAKAVAAQGGFPQTIAGLRALPGIGPYTATAIAAIAFGQAGVAIDGNVERVLARLAALETPLPAAKPDIARLAATLAAAVPPGSAADAAQALFDLGATLCTPATPACALCPWREPCAGRALGLENDLPRKLKKPARPVRHGVAFYLADGSGQVVLRRRPPRGLLGGMMELPTTAWRTEPWAEPAALKSAPASASWRPAGEVRHVFTHFELRLTVLAAHGTADGATNPAEAALPSVMRKALALGAAALAGATP